MILMFNINPKITLLLSPRYSPFFILKRFMRRATGPSFARSAFYVMETLFNKDVYEIAKKNKEYLGQQLVNLSLDHDKGIMQDKSILLNRMLTNQFNPYDIYEYYSKITGIPVICASSKLSLVDARVFSELPTLLEYYNNFHADILATRANLDSVLSIGPGLKQPNPDLTINAKVKGTVNPNNALITYIANNPCKTLIHDEKSAGGMFAHSTSGSLGILPYDSQGHVVVINNKIYNLGELLLQDKNNIHSIREGLIHDKIDVNIFEPIFRKSAEILNNKDNKPAQDVHQEYQQHLWTNLQLHPKYNRTLSYIFPKEMKFTPLKDHSAAFKERFCQLLEDRDYNLNKQGDYQEVCRAMLRAYKDTCNPQLRPLIEHYIHSKQEDVLFNSKFLNNLTYFIKHDPWLQS